MILPLTLMGAAFTIIGAFTTAGDKAGRGLAALVRSAPVRKPRDALTGVPGAFGGRAEAGPAGVAQAALSGRPALWFRATVEMLRPRDNRRRLWRERAVEEEARDFFVRDSEGNVAQVRLDGARIVTTIDYTDDETLEPTGRLAALTARQDVAVSNPVRGREERIETGAEVTIYGVRDPRAGDDAPYRSDTAAAPLFGARPGFPLIVSTLSRAATASRLAEGGHGAGLYLLCLGVVLLAISLAR